MKLNIQKGKDWADLELFGWTVELTGDYDGRTVTVDIPASIARAVGIFLLDVDRQYREREEA